MDPSKSSTSNPSQSKHHQLEKIFGTPIQILEPNVLPKKFDIIKHWIFLYDTTRTSRKVTSEEKNQIKQNLISSVVSIWKSKNLNILDKRALERKFDRLITDADKLGWDPRCRSSSGKSTWIDEQKKKFDMIFYIGEASHSEGRGVSHRIHFVFLFCFDRSFLGY